MNFIALLGFSVSYFMDDHLYPTNCYQLTPALLISGP